MTRLRVHCFSTSIDGSGAGPHQSLEHPLSVGGLALHEWIFPTRTFHRMQGKEGGTTFHFVTTGIHAALKQAIEAANGKGIRLGGGVATIRQYLRAGLIDELHVVLTPVLLGSGEQLFGELDVRNSGISAPTMCRRRTRLTWCSRRRRRRSKIVGGPLKVISWLAIKTGALTLRYAHLAPENLREAVQVFKDDYHKFSTMPGVGPTRLVLTAEKVGGPNGI